MQFEMAGNLHRIDRHQPKIGLNPNFLGYSNSLWTRTNMNTHCCWVLPKMWRFRVFWVIFESFDSHQNKVFQCTSIAFVATCRYIYSYTYFTSTDVHVWYQHIDQSSNKVADRLLNVYAYVSIDYFVHAHIYISIFQYVNIYMHIYICVYVFRHINLYIHIYVYIKKNIHTYIYTYIHIDIHKCISI